MDLDEQIPSEESKAFADAQKVTSILLNLINQLLGRPSKNLNDDSLSETGTDGLMLLFNKSADTAVLAHNITTFLMKKYANDSALWNEVANNLENEEVLWKEAANRRLSHVSSSILITIYIVVIAIGSFGNFLVVTAAARQPLLRTPRNAFIINLAVSDFLLCLVTMPLTLVEIVNDHWPLGDSVVSCKVSGGLQAVSVFVSTISITVIALDRYQLIVYPTRDVVKRIGAAAGLIFIWIMGFLLALPIFLFRTLEHLVLDSPKIAHQSDGQHHYEHDQEQSGGVHSIDYCYEKWPIDHGRAIYSACTLVIQYAVPILTISILHSQICKHLRIRQNTLEAMTVADSQRRVRETKRLRRRHYLLMAIALVFSITWLPLNVLNLFLDLYNPFNLPEEEEKMLIIYAVAHLFGMSSACANPFLYGWFNENFRTEFTVIRNKALGLCCCSSSSTAIVNNSPNTRALNRFCPDGQMTPEYILNRSPSVNEDELLVRPMEHQLKIALVIIERNVVDDLDEVPLSVQAHQLQKENDEEVVALFVASEEKTNLSPTSTANIGIREKSFHLPDSACMCTLHQQGDCLPPSMPKNKSFRIIRNYRSSVKNCCETQC